MTAKYKILFMTELLHDYYGSLQCPDFSIIPSEETRQLMIDRQLMYKQTGNKLVVLVKVKTNEPDPADDDKPLVSINPEDKFIFYLELNNPQFMTITNTDEEKFRLREKYYFSNLPQNNLDGEQSLTAKIESLPALPEYIPGDIMADAAGIVYECIKKTNSFGNPPAAADWHARVKRQYVSARDMLDVKTRTENYTLTTAATVFQISLKGLNLATNQYTTAIPLEENLLTSKEDTKNVHIKLPALRPGRYILTINSENFDVFIDDAAVYNNVFGIIEVFSHFPNNTPFSFFDANGKVRDKIVAGKPAWLKYKIHFANRLAYWKYKTPRFGVDAIAGISPYTFAHALNGDGKKESFTSNKPVPLLEKPWKFKVDVAALADIEDPFAANPDPSVTGVLTRTKDEKDYYCTINLNY